MTKENDDIQDYKKPKRRLTSAQQAWVQCVDELYFPNHSWVGLTDEERAIFEAANPKTQEEWDKLFDGIEVKLRSKNT